MAVVTPFGDLTLGDETALERWVDAHAGRHSAYTVATGIPLNTRFTYQIQLLANDQLTVTANGHQWTHTLDPSFASTAFFFKAGDYPQDNVGPSTEGGRVAFYALSLTPAD